MDRGATLWQYSSTFLLWFVKFTFQPTIWVSWLTYNVKISLRKKRPIHYRNSPSVPVSSHRFSELVLPLRVFVRVWRLAHWSSPSVSRDLGERGVTTLRERKENVPRVDTPKPDVRSLGGTVWDLYFWHSPCTILALTTNDLCFPPRTSLRGNVLGIQEETDQVFLNTHLRSYY